MRSRRRRWWRGVVVVVSSRGERRREAQYTIRSQSFEVPTVRSTEPAASKPSASRFAFLRRRGWKFYVALGVAIPSIVVVAVVVYFYISFSRVIDARMHGEFQRTDPRIFARPLEIHRSQRVTEPQVIDRLNDLGYAQRAGAEHPGEFAIGRDALVVIPRGGERAGETLRFAFAPPGKTGAPGPIQSIESITRKQRLESVSMEAPLLTALVEGREKRRDVPLSAIAPRMVQAVVAIEDRRFYDHPGVDVI